ncbi:GNAT family N-acetyltransferase [Martelella soudanensis]|uniref:GNAT family N-acetyltransferase n=1 Tax=unclassified Martelella TaxID=2629616 RepID=UPI0015DFDD8B|nr:MULTISPECIES: GNAT family N-acetyltransferase [unclassified Martelella]
MLPSFLKRPPDFDLFPLEDEHLTLAADLHRKWFSPSWSAGEFRKLLAQNPVYGHIVRANRRASEAAGFVLARSVDDESEILTICVDRQFSRNGLGWRLMVAAMQEARARGAQAMLLEVSAENAAALSLYGRLGFVEVGRRKAYYTHDDGTRTTALVMRRELG